jgi:Reverse transcriptase (RNA-dependent DNA polymerase)
MRLRAIPFGAGEVHVPKSVEEALASPQASFWQEAMDSEVASLYENGTWELVERPRGVRPVGVKWVFDLKVDSHGNILRFKARLVAKGFMQVEGVDFEETYAPVSKYSTTRAILALAASEGWEVQQLDMKTAFLQGELQERVFVEQPPYFTDGTDRVCLLYKALYGLKQAPRAWYEHMHEKLGQLGYAVSAADPGLYVCTKVGPDGGRVLLLVYVDDMLLASPSAAVVAEAKAQLLSAFDARDVGGVSDFVGMHIERDVDQGTITISNPRMINDLLSRYGMTNAKGNQVPISSEAIKELKREGVPLDQKRFPYSALVGSLLYLAITVRPDISFAVGALSRFMSCPTVGHWWVAKGVLRYLAAHPNLGITYGGSSSGEGLRGWCDADYAGDQDVRRSTTGYVFTINGGAVSWASKRQPTVALSTAEAEYMAACAATREAVWLRQLVVDLGMPVTVVPIAGDNQACLNWVHNQVVSAKSKHIAVQHHFVRERVALRQVSFSWVPTAEQAADVFTKPLKGDAHWACCAMLGMHKVQKQ